MLKILFIKIKDARDHQFESMSEGLQMPLSSSFIESNCC